MYKEYTLEQLKKNLKLPKNYKVDAVVVYGGWDLRRYRRKFLSIIKKKYSIEKLNFGFLKPVMSVKVGNKRIWFIVEYGGAKLSEFIHFASMLGSKKNILVGTCGGLQKGLSKTQIIVPSASYSTESSSHMYTKDSKDNLFYPNKELSEKLIEKLKNYNLDVVHEKTLTCEAMMGESWEDILSWEKQGYYGVEMEAATVFSVSKHFNVKSAAVVQIADNLIEKETVHDESYEKKKLLLNKIRKNILEVATNLALGN